MTKHIEIEGASRAKLMEGISTISKIVGATLGPCGSNVILKKDYNVPIIVNDGISIAREISLTDPTANAGAELLTSAAACTNASVGDGTTTTCILTEAIARYGFEEIENGVNPILLREALKEVAEESIYPMLEKQIERCDTLESLQNVATVSVGGSEVYGKIVGEAVLNVGSEGIIHLENNPFPETKLSMVEGYKIDRGYMTPYAINNTEKYIVDYSKCLVLCCYHPITERSDLEKLFSYAHQSGKHILLILESMDESLFAALNTNLMRKVFSICPVKSPGFGFNVRDYMNDIAQLTGCVVYADDTRRMSTFTPDDFGYAERVTATRENTCILSGSDKPSESLESYVTALKNQLAATENSHLIESLKERISKLTVGVATISVGAPSEAEQVELKLRIEDAINATKSAFKGGIVTGGGTALAHIAYTLLGVEADHSSQAKAAAEHILIEACKVPLLQLMENSGCGQNPIDLCFKEDPNYGFNGRTKSWENLKEAGIVDPALVVKSALENAISIASIILTTKATVVSDVTV